MAQRKSSSRKFWMLGAFGFALVLVSILFVGLIATNTIEAPDNGGYIMALLLGVAVLGKGIFATAGWGLIHQNR